MNKRLVNVNVSNVKVPIWIIKYQNNNLFRNRDNYADLIYFSVTDISKIIYWHKLMMSLICLHDTSKDNPKIVYGLV